MRPISMLSLLFAVCVLALACAEAGTSDPTGSSALPIPLLSDARPLEAGPLTPEVLVSAVREAPLSGEWWICNGGDFDRLVRLRLDGPDLVGEVVRTDGSVDPLRGFHGPYDAKERVWNADLLDDICYVEPCPTWMRVTFDPTESFLSGVDFSEHAVRGARHDGKYVCPGH